MTAALDFRAQIRVNNALRERLPDHALAERQKVQVDVLDAIACERLVLDDGCAYPRDLVRRVRRADVRSSKLDAAFDVCAGDRVGVRPLEWWAFVIRRC